MKLIKTIFCALFILVSSSSLLPAQDSIVIVTAQAQGLNLVSASDLPDSGGTFWMVTSNGALSPCPCPPQDASLPVFQITDSQFLVDATGGQVATEPNQSVSDALAALADAVANLISQIQGAVPSQSLSRGGMHAMDLPGPGDGDTNGFFTPPDVPDITFTTNQLWLQIVAKTNTTAYLVIHPPWNVTNGVYDLLYTTNLALPIVWQWVLRTDPGQTNLVVSNAVDGLGFYALGQPNDLVANDSLGTNFWVGFMGMENPTIYNLSLYISSPVGATGMVNIPGFFVNDTTMIATNCGDPAINGTYLLTNLTAQEQMDWDGSGLDSNGITYVNTSNGTNWVNLFGGNWRMFGYDPANPGAANFDFEYIKYGINLNGSAADWQMAGDSATSPTTVCVQHPFTASFTVAAGAATNIALDESLMISSDDVVGTNGIHVIASAPVSVYALNYDAELSAAFTCYPTPLLGTNYCLMARPSFYNVDQSEFAIVATASNTTVTITPSITANLAGSYWTNSFMLQQGQTYQVISQDGTNDVTGTRITSDKPIGVFAGASDADVPDAGTEADNPLVQEQLPVEAWGTQALSMGFAGRLNGDNYRILAAYNNTMVTITSTNGTFTTNLTAGAFCETNLGGPVEFQANLSVQVAQFANGASFDGSGNQEGDPCEILLPPTGHYLETNMVVSFTNDLPYQTIGDFDENYMNLIVAQPAISNTLVDGSTIAATNFMAIGTSGYYGVQLIITNSGVHKITSSQPVGVEVYGFGGFDAYGYFGGVVK